MRLKPRPDSPAPASFVVDLLSFGSLAVLVPAFGHGELQPAVLPADAAFALFEPINPPEFPA